MKKLVLLLCFISLFTLSESKAQWRLAAGIDVLSTPFFENIPKYRFGAEAQYFVANRFALTGGLEFIEKDLGGSAGFRFYPINPVFLRMRGILKNNSDLALGMGYAIGLNSNWRLETMADYFAVSSGFAMRVGVAVKL
ncbi:hypothetical protein SAMN05661096_04060 [Marivirga sericea]|uniref:Outer membrane protein beta-barrel domain-containing protein n=1 Tax=Marivirga sericea TaxID=1028 RepID=A0A1X7LIR2_9BACT|nr:hypothetical protein [Marivirga sericea]SMG53213.1 hypothetical protein SAMN05661096_04060 [Marivirga sericea]